MLRRLTNTRPPRAPGRAAEIGHTTNGRKGRSPLLVRGKLVCCGAVGYEVDLGRFARFRELPLQARCRKKASGSAYAAKRPAVIAAGIPLDPAANPW